MASIDNDEPMHDASPAGATSSQDEAGPKSYKIDPITALQDGIGKITHHACSDSSLVQVLFVGSSRGLEVMQLASLLLGLFISSSFY